MSKPWTGKVINVFSLVLLSPIYQQEEALVQKCPAQNHPNDIQLDLTTAEESAYIDVVGGHGNNLLHAGIRYKCFIKITGKNSFLKMFPYRREFVKAGVIGLHSNH